MQLKNYDVKIFPACSTGSNIFRLNFCGFGSCAQVYFTLYTLTTLSINVVCVNRNIIVRNRYFVK